MIDAHEAEFGEVDDRTIFEGEFVVPPHLRNANFQRQSSIMFLGTMSRSRTFLTLKDKGYHGSVPDLTRLGSNQTTKSLDFPKSRPSIAAIREHQTMHVRAASTCGAQLKGVHQTKPVLTTAKIPQDPKALLHSSTSFSIKRPSLVASKSNVSNKSRMSASSSVMNINEIAREKEVGPGWGPVRSSCSYLKEANAFTLPRPKISINSKRNGDSAA